MPATEATPARSQAQLLQARQAMPQTAPSTPQLELFQIFNAAPRALQVPAPQPQPFAVSQLLPRSQGLPPQPPQPQQPPQQPQSFNPYQILPQPSARSHICVGFAPPLA